MGRTITKTGQHKSRQPAWLRGVQILNRANHLQYPPASENLAATSGPALSDVPGKYREIGNQPRATGRTRHHEPARPASAAAARRQPQPCHQHPWPRCAACQRPLGLWGVAPKAAGSGPALPAATSSGSDWGHDVGWITTTQDEGLRLEGLNLAWRVWVRSTQAEAARKWEAPLKAAASGPARTTCMASGLFGVRMEA